MPYRFKPKIEEFIYLYYNNSIKNLCTYYNIDKTTSTKFAKHIGLKTKKEYYKNFGANKQKDIKRKKKNQYYQNIRYDYFDNIDTKDKAYYLGLIASDGCVYTSNNRNILQISLKSNDEYIYYKIFMIF